MLASGVLGLTRAALYSHPEAPIDGAQAAALHEAVARRARGEPVAHILGRREFWGLDLRVTRDTLIPRPDTETLVACALRAGDAAAALQVADLGTGSGAIGLALAAERPRWSVTATDVSAAALAVARGNARRLGLANVHVARGSWFDALPGGARWDLIVSNPPYVAEGDPHLTRGDVRFEPRRALAAGADGLTDLRHLVAQAPAHLAPGGWLIVEHGYDQGPAVRALFEAAGFVGIVATRDLAGQPRVVEGRLG